MKISPDFKEKLFFLIAGSLAGLINFFTKIISDITYSTEVSILVGFIFGLISAFFMMRIIFKAKNRISSSFSIFFIVNIINIMLIYFVTLNMESFFYAQYPTLGYIKEIAHFLGICSTVVPSFLFHKYLTFKI